MRSPIRGITGIVLLAVAVSGGGCSTYRNLVPSEAHDCSPMEIYGGVKMASAGLYQSPKVSEGGLGMKTVWPLTTLDLLASAVADTFTLPITICSTLYRHYWVKPVDSIMRYEHVGPPLMAGPGEVISRTKTSQTSMPE